MYEGSWILDPIKGCHLWIGIKYRNGYGRVKCQGAHRVIYEAEVGPIPRDMYIDHICKVRNCVNVNHMRIVTPKQNVLENSNSLQAMNARKTHCKRGHRFSKKNTRHSAGGSRICRACGRLRTKPQGGKSHRNLRIDRH